MGRKPSRSVRGGLAELAEGALDRLDRAPLGLADRPLALGMRPGDTFGEAHHEAPVVRELLRLGLALEQRDCVPYVLQGVIPELLERAVARAVDLRLGRDDL